MMMMSDSSAGPDAHMSTFPPPFSASAQKRGPTKCGETRQDIYDALDHDLAQPIGMEDFTIIPKLEIVIAHKVVHVAKEDVAVPTYRYLVNPIVACRLVDESPVGVPPRAR
jgi:hypothetical protein